MSVSEKVWKRRDFLELAVKSTILTGLALSTQSDLIRILPRNLSRVLPDGISISISTQPSVSIPVEWYDPRIIPQLRIGPIDSPRTIGQGDIGAADMSRFPYTANCRSGKKIKKDMYGLGLPEALEKLKFRGIEKIKGVEAGATDYYTARDNDIGNLALSISKDHIPIICLEKDKHTLKKEAIEHKVTFTAVVAPSKHDAVEDIFNVEQIILSDKSYEQTGAFFRDQHGNPIKARYDIPETTENNHYFDIFFQGKPYAKLYYKDIKKEAEKNPVVYKGNEVASVHIKKLLSMAKINPDNKFLKMYAPGYSVAATSEDELLMTFDKRNIDKYQGFAKLVSDTTTLKGKMNRRAKLIGGPQRIEVEYLKA
ncbi:hypothetical protein KY348_06170 [Candidatus Woesearchaeota archaeon]|nr:hypothetical protein [Candidatus Woesearchaeota archaeon]